jgi:hypothetical protein
VILLNLNAKDRGGGTLIVDLEVGGEIGLDLPDGVTRVRRYQQIVYVDRHHDLDVIAPVDIDRIVTVSTLETESPLAPSEASTPRCAGPA